MNLLLTDPGKMVVLRENGGLSSIASYMDIDVCLLCYEGMHTLLKYLKILPSYSALRARYVGDVRWIEFRETGVKIAKDIGDSVTRVQEKLRKDRMLGWGPDTQPLWKF